MIAHYGPSVGHLYGTLDHLYVLRQWKLCSEDSEVSGISGKFELESYEGHTNKHGSIRGLAVVGHVCAASGGQFVCICVSVCVCVFQGVYATQ